MSSIQRKLALLVGGAFAAMALVAPSALAMEVSDAENTPCPSVKPAIQHATEEDELGAFFSQPEYESGGCTVHVTADTNTPDLGITKLVYTPAMVDECNLSYDLHIGPDGWGYVDNMIVGNSGPGECLHNWSTGAPLSGSVVIGPGNPYGLFPAADSDTEFNLYPYAHAPHWCCGAQILASGPMSLDVTQADPLKLDNQYEEASESFTGGAWEGDVGLIISN